MSKVKFRVESSQDLPLDPFEIELNSGSVVAFVGYNATLKSLTARALLYELCQTANRHFDFVTSLETRTEDASKALKLQLVDAPKDLLPYLVDDYRLSLRAYFSILQNAIDRLESYAKEVSDDRTRELMLSELDALRKNLQPQLFEYPEIKKNHDLDLLLKAKEIFEKKINEIKEQTSVGDEILLPLKVDITDSWKVHDKRLDKSVPLNLASTTIAAALLWTLTLYFFSIPVSARLFAVEEPEEAMTPLQQVAYVEVLKALAREIPGDNYVVLTTHSPYIAGESDKIFYFSFENKKFTCKPVDIPLPMAKTDSLLLLRSIEK
jgi:hypothetical protein